MNTLILKEVKVTILIIVLSITGVFNNRGFNETEATMCKKILPRSDSECLKSHYFKTLVCCSVKMDKPFTGNVCMPLSMAAKGTNGKYNRELPNNLFINGQYTCDGRFLKGDLIFFYVLIIFLVINLL